MKSRSCIVCLLLVLSLLISSCTEEENGDYSGVSELISERNKARYQSNKDSSDRKKVIARPQKQTPGTLIKSTPKDEEQEEISSIVLYEQNIEIVGKESGKVLAKGVAYINKQGQIVKIKIVR